MELSYDITTKKQLKEFVKELARLVSSGQVIGLIGELGSGKTTFAKELLKLFGVFQQVISPTYLYEQIYDANRSGIRSIKHIDLYRVKSDEEVDQLGLGETGGGELTIVEWIDKSPSLLRIASWIVKFELLGSQKRRITLIRKP